MRLSDLLPDFKAQKRAPEDLAQDFAEATVKATPEEMSVFRYQLQAQEFKDKKKNDAYQAYTTLVVLFAAKNPQYVKKVQEFSTFVEMGANYSPT